MIPKRSVDVGLLRMAQFLFLAAGFYAAVIYVVTFYPPSGVWPQVQTALWKAGHFNIGVFLGFWADRGAYGLMEPKLDSDGRLLSRAIMIAAGVLGMEFGL